MSTADTEASPLVGSFQLECDLAGRAIFTHTIPIASVESTIFPDDKAVQSLIDNIFDTNPGVQAVYFIKHPIDSPVSELKSDRHELVYRPSETCLCYFTKINEFLPKTGKSASNLRRADKAIKSLAGDAFHIVFGKTDIENIGNIYMPAFSSITNNSWKSNIQGKAAGLKSEENKINQLNEANQLFYAVLGESPVSYFRGRLRDRVLRVEKLGYDEQYEKHSPGRVLITKILDWARNHPEVIDLIDWGWGDYEYKRYFATSSILMQNTVVRPKNWTGA